MVAKAVETAEREASGQAPSQEPQLGVARRRPLGPCATGQHTRTDASACQRNAEWNNERQHRGGAPACSAASSSLRFSPARYNA